MGQYPGIDNWRDVEVVGTEYAALRDERKLYM